MKKVTREISKEEFNRLQKLNHSEQERELFPDGIPDAWRWGYGYYGHRLVESDDKYYAEFTIGNSCD